MRKPRTWLGKRATALIGIAAMLTSMVALPASAAATPSISANTAFNAGHLNILHSMSHQRFVHDLNLITSRAGLVGLNEVANRRDFLQNWAAANGWHFYAPGPRPASQEALLAKKSMFDVISRGSKFACDTNGSDALPPARYTNWVRYRHKASGRSVYHVNAHANAHIDNNGHPYNLPRTDCAEKQFRDIKALARNKKDHGQVIVTGDLNVDFVDDRRVQYVNFPWSVFEKNALPNLRSSYNIYSVKGTGTHGDRHIDYIYFWKRLEQYRRIWMTSYDIVGGTESDHNGIVARFAIQL